LEVRVLGALLEKEQATPAYYPMTVTSLVQACNQKTNRSPVMALSADEVQATLERLFQEDVFAWRSRAGRSVKWKQNIDRRWQLAPAAKAVLTVLMLRGPQTVGELRARTDRLHAFEDLPAVERALATLAAGEEPMVRELPRQPGQKESRWTHLLGDRPQADLPQRTRPLGARPPANHLAEAHLPQTQLPELGAGETAAMAVGDPVGVDARSRDAAPGDRLEELEQRVAALENLWAEIARQLGVTQP
jgi:uncharacterized protein YceH (UPF0502 family)